MTAPAAVDAPDRPRMPRGALAAMLARAPGGGIAAADPDTVHAASSAPPATNTPHTTATPHARGDTPR
jgi:hypothetical protein